MKYFFLNKGHLKTMSLSVEMQSDEGPGEYKYRSTVFVYHNESTGVSSALHLCPLGVKKEDMCLGSMARAAYHTLETVGCIPLDSCFVMLHFATCDDSAVVDVTMLPVGDDAKREALATGLKSGKEGFQSLLDEVVNMCISDVSVDVVTVLYDSMQDIVSNQSKTAIIHELQTRVNRDLLEGFMTSVGSPV
jgi:hypothetical protein